MNHTLTMSNTECLLVRQALERVEEDRKAHKDDRDLARRLKSRISEKINMDLSIESAEQAKDKYRS